MLVVLLFAAQAVPSTEPQDNVQAVPITKPPENVGNLVVACDEPCLLAVNGDDLGALGANDAKKLRVPFGEQLIVALDQADRSIRWSHLVKVTSNEQVVVVSELGRQRRVARAAARARERAAVPTPTPLPPGATESAPAVSSLEGLWRGEIVYGDAVREVSLIANASQDGVWLSVFAVRWDFRKARKEKGIPYFSPEDLSRESRSTFQLLLLGEGPGRFSGRSSDGAIVSTVFEDRKPVAFDRKAIPKGGFTLTLDSRSGAPVLTVVCEVPYCTPEDHWSYRLVRP